MLEHLLKVKARGKAKAKGKARAKEVVEMDLTTLLLCVSTAPRLVMLFLNAPSSLLPVIIAQLNITARCVQRAQVVLCGRL